MTQTKGYEYYAKNQQLMKMAGDVGTKAALDLFLSVQFWGTPEMIYEKIMSTRKLIGCDLFSGVFSYAGMDAAEAERNMRLFAAEVMPELKKVPKIGSALEPVAV